MSISVTIKKELDNGKTITYKLKFIDSFRFMSTTLSKLVKFLSDRLHIDKCTNCESNLDYMSVKEFVLMNTWIARKDLMRHYLIKKLFIVI